MGLEREKPIVPAPMPPRNVQFLLDALDVFEKAAKDALRKAEEQQCR